MVRKERSSKRAARLKPGVMAAAVLTTLVVAPAHAFQIESDNPDVSIRWDNHIRYNLGWRMKDPNGHFANAFGADETESVFKKNDLIMNRLDVLSEFDYTIKDRYGFRVSAALWSENAYPSNARTGDLINSTFPGAFAVPSNYGASGRYSAYAKRYVTGSSGEFLDAFAFGSFDLGSTQLSLKVGQHNLYWGEALYSAVDGVSAGQGPIDSIKAAVSPGAEAKELFLPLSQVSVSWNINSELTLLGQYLLDWKPYRNVPGGTYFAAADGSGDLAHAGTPVCASTAPGGTCIAYLDPVTPGRNGGDFGLAARWSPVWANGTLGFYYRKYDEKLPWASIQLQNFVATNPANLGLRMSYGRDTELYGFSFSRSIAGVSAALELSYRHNTALNSVSGFFAGSQAYRGLTGATPTYFLQPAVANIALDTTPGYSLVEGARGDTYHFLVNGVYLLPQTALWEAGTLQAELAYQRLSKVTKNATVFYGEGYGCATNYLTGLAQTLDKSDGCATKDSFALSLGFTPQWLQVVPNVDLSLPTSLSYGLKGNSPTLGGSYEGAYRWSIGLKATYLHLYDFTVQLAGQHQDYKTVTATAANGVPGQTVHGTAAGTMPVQNSHTWLNVGFKTSF